MYYFDSNDEWKSIHEEDLWVYNKLILNTRLRHLCGPTGVPVPYPGNYIVRPSINILGMGRFSRVVPIEDSTEHFHPAEFWCEIFEGEHMSVDFYRKESSLVVIGEKQLEAPFYKWKKWYKVDRKVEFPEILNDLKGDYEWINCEFIDNKLIEVHFRRNPDFRYGNNVAIPVWVGEKIEKMENLTFVEDKDYLREGFYIDTRDSNPVKSSDLTNQEQKNDQKSR
jgi:hypothetical protein